MFLFSQKCKRIQKDLCVNCVWGMNCLLTVHHVYSLIVWWYVDFYIFITGTCKSEHFYKWILNALLLSCVQIYKMHWVMSVCRMGNTLLCKTNFRDIHVYIYIITKSMHMPWLVNQLWVIVLVNPRKIRVSSELLCKSNRPQVSMGYRQINHLGCW